VKTLETSLRHLRDSGRKALVPYFVAGLTPDWVRHVEAAILAGADAVEIGIPFSDPMMDGVVIQAAALRALNAGTTLDSLCTDLAGLSATAPLVAMTYYNVFHHYGLERAAGKLQASGIAGAIVPDLSLEESDEWARACDDHDVTTIFLFAPVDRPGSGATTHRGDPGLRLRLGTNGRHRSGSRHRGCPTSRRTIRASSDVPTYVGIGIATPEIAREAAAVSDGVIVGSALVQIILNGAGTKEIESFIGSFRRAID